VVGAKRNRRSSAHIVDLCSEWAAVLHDAFIQERPQLGGEFEPDDEVASRLKPCFEQLWVNEFVASAQWKVVSKTKHDHINARKHINVLEVRARNEAIAHLAPKYPDTCAVYGLDSKVALGATAKGRSPSMPLLNELLLALPDCVGFGHFPGGVFIPTRLIPADDPSRDVDLRGPRCKIPLWVKDVALCDFSALDGWTSLPTMKRAEGEWVRFACKLSRPLLYLQCLSSLPPRLQRKHHPKPEATDGEARVPGPRPQALPLEARIPKDLISDRVLTAQTVKQRQKSSIAFADWLREHKGLETEFLLADGTDSLFVARILAAFGQHCYNIGFPLGFFVNAILSITDKRRFLVGKVKEAWDVVETWTELIPLGHHKPLLRVVLHAIVTLAFSWKWFGVGLLLLLGFSCMLRVSEMFSLRRDRLLLPSDLLSDNDVFFVNLGSTKTRRLGARMQHVRTSDSELVMLLEEFCHGAPPSARFYSGTRKQLEQDFEALLNHFAFVYGSNHGFTLASLRAGAATQMYRDGVELSRIQWAGRWRSSRTLEIYIQEVAALNVLAELDLAQRHKIRWYATSFQEMCQYVIEALRVNRAKFAF
jgi:hypothetical protein